MHPHLSQQSLQPQSYRPAGHRYLHLLKQKRKAHKSTQQQQTADILYKRNSRRLCAFFPQYLRLMQEHKNEFALGVRMEGATPHENLRFLL